jgi:hypothetical protein
MQTEVTLGQPAFQQQQAHAEVVLHQQAQASAAPRTRR